LKPPTSYSLFTVNSPLSLKDTQNFQPVANLPFFQYISDTQPHVRRLLHRLLRFQWIRREDVSAERGDTQALEARAGAEEVMDVGVF